LSSLPPLPLWRTAPAELAEFGFRKPTTGIVDGWARAASGHTVAAPLMTAMTSRRLMHTLDLNIAQYHHERKPCCNRPALMSHGTQQFQPGGVERFCRRCRSYLRRRRDLRLR
jgi:hypothetical protein